MSRLAADMKRWAKEEATGKEGYLHGLSSGATKLFPKLVEEHGSPGKETQPATPPSETTVPDDEGLAFVMKEASQLGLGPLLAEIDVDPSAWIAALSAVANYPAGVASILPKIFGSDDMEYPPSDSFSPSITIESLPSTPLLVLRVIEELKSRKRMGPLRK